MATQTRPSTPRNRAAAARRGLNTLTTPTSPFAPGVGPDEGAFTEADIRANLASARQAESSARSMLGLSTSTGSRSNPLGPLSEAELMLGGLRGDRGAGLLPDRTSFAFQQQQRQEQAALAAASAEAQAAAEAQAEAQAAAEAQALAGAQASALATADALGFGGATPEQVSTGLGAFPDGGTAVAFPEGGQPSNPAFVGDALEAIDRNSGVGGFLSSLFGVEHTATPDISGVQREVGLLNPFSLATSLLTGGLVNPLVGQLAGLGVGAFTPSFDVNTTTGDVSFGGSDLFSLGLGAFGGAGDFLRRGGSGGEGSFAERFDNARFAGRDNLAGNQSSAGVPISNSDAPPPIPATQQPPPPNVVPPPFSFPSSPFNFTQGATDVPIPQISFPQIPADQLAQFRRRINRFGV